MTFIEWDNALADLAIELDEAAEAMGIDIFKVFESIKYDEKKYFFDEDFTGKESRFFVMEGDDV